jgi:PAS domain S-box-containing protein
MIIGKKLNVLPVSVGVDAEKCINCHACITSCPVKYCNDGSGDYVSVNPYMCIGCGNCIKKCTHQARLWFDDFDRLLEDLSAGEKIIVIVAPSIAANFPSQYLNVNGWLKSIGVEAFFDVSFGAELTVKSYIDYLQSDKIPGPVITQPCPAIVTYIEMYTPELLPYLAPVDSPMLHTMKMIRNFYPQYKDHKIAAISPCLAKKREFEETGLGDYNVGFLSMSNYFKKYNIDLSTFQQEPYSNPSAERAVGFSSPGGLLKTAERWWPGITEASRRIEGSEHIYPYLDNLPQSIKNGTAPLLIDCLNCEKGCNQGPLTITEQIPLDDMEMNINERSEQTISLYNAQSDNKDSQNSFNQLLSSFWDKSFYNRDYQNLSINNRIIVPSDIELKNIYKLMRKTGQSDFYNCSACGYGTCENMAIAIYNGLNRPENCHFYLAEEAKLKTSQISENEKRLRTILSTTTAGFCLADAEFRLVVVNLSFCKIVGMDREKLTGSTFLKKQLEKCSSGKEYSTEIRINRADGSPGYFCFIANPYFSDTKELQGYFALLFDVGKYKKNTGTAQIPGENS